MLIVGAIGLGVNIVAAFVLHSGSKHSLNVDGAFKHVLADLMGSVGVVISGLIVIFTGWVLIDPILSLGIALLIVVSSWRLVLRSVNVLLGGVPDHIDLYALCADIEDVPGVTLIHDVHAWSISEGYHAFTAHVVLETGYTANTDAFLTEMRRIVYDKHRVSHLTVQFEESASDCLEAHHLGHLEARSRFDG